MAKKAVQAVLQEEINNDDDWTKMSRKSGVYIIDVYAEWCGPCVVMIRFLKKIKLELNSEFLHFAIAKSDNITTLKRFRQKSQPIWMFLVDGKLVNLCIGVNSPKLMKLIANEVEMYYRFKKGEIQRRFIPWNETTAEEQQKMVENKQYEKQIMKKERKIRDDRMLKVRERGLKQFTINAKMQTCVIYFPHTIKSTMIEAPPEEIVEEGAEPSKPAMVEKRVCEVAESCTPKYKELDIFVAEAKEVQLTKEMLSEVFFVDKEIFESFSLDLVDQLLNKKIYLEMLSSPVVQQDDDVDNLGWIEQNMCALIYGNGGPLKPSPGSLAAEHMIVNDFGEKTPSMYTPTNPLSKASALAILFQTFCAINGYESPMPPPPQYLVIFEINRSNTVLPIIEEFEEKIVHYGFFRSADPENPRLLCKDPELLITYGMEKLGKDAKLILSVLKDEKDKSLLRFVDAGPNYVSPDYEVGINDAIKFFPHDFEELDGELKVLLARDEGSMAEGEEELLDEREGEEEEEINGSQL